MRPGFNSRAPRGARPSAPRYRQTSRSVSIHVPLAEHDLRPHYGRGAVMSFNSRAPRGARPLFLPDVVLSEEFQFTCPSRSTTCRWTLHQSRQLLFQFTCPSRSTTSGKSLPMPSMSVSIHVPLAEHDPGDHRAGGVPDVSIHVPLAEHDSSKTLFSANVEVSIHVPLAEHDKLFS